jgi:hypothetical protein
MGLNILENLAKTFLTYEKMSEFNEDMRRLISSYPVKENEKENIIVITKDDNTDKILIAVFGIDSERKLCSIKEKMSLKDFLKQMMGL